MKKYLIVIFYLGMLLLPEMLRAQEINEDELFGDEESFVTTEESQDEGIAEDVTGESVSFSGAISGNFAQNITRAYLDGDDDFADNPYTTSIDGDFLLDVRLRKGIKSFANLWATYTPQDDPNDSEAENFQTTLKELFVDVNVARKVYFRFGKQNLKWGQGYLWNPTDLISVDRKDFSDIDARREGVYGLKAHVPFGTTVNLYGFVNTSGAARTDEFAVAGKLEFLVLEDVEIAVSAWTKKNYNAVYGLDFATRKFDTNLWGELSVSNGDNRHRLEARNTDTGIDYVDKEITDEWVPRMCVGFTRYFDFGEFKNRISLTGEFYYNDGGYEDNMLENEETRATFLDGGYFESGDYGKYYAAVFATVGRFIMTDMVLNLNAIGNLSDSSFMASSGVDYQLASNAVLSTKLTGFLGSKNREYTVHGNALSAEISVNIVF